MKSHNITSELAKKIGDNLKVDWNKYNLEDFRKGMIVEMEHGKKYPKTNVTDDDLLKTGKIALIHMIESPEYYADLDKDSEPDPGEKEYLMTENPAHFMQMKKKNDREEAKKDNEEQEEGDTDMPKIGGTGLLALLDDALNMPINPFEILKNSDFNMEDNIVKRFNDNHGGIKGIVSIIKSPEAKQSLCSIVDDLKNYRIASCGGELQEIFTCIKGAQKGMDVAENQTEAITRINQLLKIASIEEKTKLETIKQCVLSGNPKMFDVASFRVRTLYASIIPPTNVRVAFTYLEEPIGQAFLLCPKARYQIGYAIPMEQSKCRDHCIESRTTKDGKVTCAYSDWLRVCADNQNAVNNRLEVVKHSLNDESIGSIPIAARSNYKGGTDTYEQMLEERHLLQKKNKNSKLYPSDTESDKSQSTEARLDEVSLYHHQGEDVKRPQDMHNTKIAEKMKGIDPYSSMTTEQQLRELVDGTYADDIIERLLEREDVSRRNLKDDSEIDEATEILLQHTREKYPEKYKKIMELDD